MVNISKKGGAGIMIIPRPSTIMMILSAIRTNLDMLSLCRYRFNFFLFCGLDSMMLNSLSSSFKELSFIACWKRLCSSLAVSLSILLCESNTVNSPIFWLIAIMFSSFGWKPTTSIFIFFLIVNGIFYFSITCAYKYF